MSKTFKWALVGDLQIPYEDKRAVALWFKVMKSWKPDAIDFVGDIDDQLEYSRFSDGTTDEFASQLKKTDTAPLEFIRKNADGARAFYEKVRQQHQDADMHLSMGNHDIRIFGYVDKKFPDFVDQVTPNLLWAVDDLGISYRFYHENPYPRFEGIHVHHGTTLSNTTLTTVRNDIENYDVSLVRGHSHRATIVHKHYPLSGRMLTGMETGHMCDPAQYGLQYTVNPDWNLGFGLAHIADGHVKLEFVPISYDYTCVVDGKVFKG